MRRIAELGNVTLDWLLTGEGPKHKKDLTGPLDQESDKEIIGPGLMAQSQAEYTAKALGSEYVLVPRYGVQASAGGGEFVDSEQVVDYLVFKTVWIRREMGLDPEKLALITATGDSMQPTLNPDDLLLIDLRITQVKDDAIYILRIDDILLAKRIQCLYDGTIYIRSDNPAYKEQAVPKNKVASLCVIGRVVWIGKKV